MERAREAAMARDHERFVQATAGVTGILWLRPKGRPLCTAAPSLGAYALRLPRTRCVPAPSRAVQIKPNACRRAPSLLLLGRDLGTGQQRPIKVELAKGFGARGAAHYRGHCCGWLR